MTGGQHAAMYGADDPAPEITKLDARHTKRRQICADGTVVIGHIQVCKSTATGIAHIASAIRSATPSFGSLKSNACSLYVAACIRMYSQVEMYRQYTNAYISVSITLQIVESSCQPCHHRRVCHTTARIDAERWAAAVLNGLAAFIHRLAPLWYTTHIPAARSSPACRCHKQCWGTAVRALWCLKGSCMAAL